MRPPIRANIRETQRQKIERVEQTAAGETWVMGRVMLEGPGEVIVPISFPVTFGEKPLPILGGGEAASETGRPKPMYFPRISATVVDWDDDGSYYKGATIAILAEGQPGQAYWATYAFVGIALTNAVVGEDDNG